MNIYVAVRDWVDRSWRGRNYKILLLPVLVPALAIAMLDGGSVAFAAGGLWFAAWAAFVFWRYWFYMKDTAREADEQYDRVGKFRLAKEYHATESATAAAKRKRNG